VSPFFKLLYQSPNCAGSPTIVTATATETTWGACPNDWVITLAASFSSIPAGFELEWWRATDSGGTNFAFWQRKALSSPGTTDTQHTFGSDGSGDPRTEYRKYKARIVPAASANGAGPFCDDQETSQLSRAGGDCVD
jgi:hypothetical protein